MQLTRKAKEDKHNLPPGTPLSRPTFRPASPGAGRPNAVERARLYLAKLSPAIEGARGSDACFRAACVLVHGFALEPKTALALLESDYNPRCDPPWSTTELQHKVDDAVRAPSSKPYGYLLDADQRSPGTERREASPLRRPPKYPPPGPARIKQVLGSGADIRQLVTASPHGWDDERFCCDDGSNCGLVVRALFADEACPDPLLCVGQSSREFATRPLSSWEASGRLNKHALVVPAPMTARTGLTKGGKESEHTLHNTGPRRFVVAEFDVKPSDKTGNPTLWAPFMAARVGNGTGEREAAADICAALLLHLAGFATLALAVHSGGKSLHGWYPLAGASETDADKFMRYAASLGADSALFRNPSQFVRLPGGLRDTGCRQSILYWNPAALVPAATGKDDAR